MTNNTQFKPVTHCIFDMDGLLLDTETLYTEAFSQIVAPYGKIYTWEHKARIMGLRTTEVAAAIIKILDLPMKPEEFEAQAKKLYIELFCRSKLLPDTEKIYKVIYQNICSMYGQRYESDIQFQVLGRPERTGAEMIIEHYKLPLSANEFQHIYHRLQKELFTDVKLMPGAERLLRHLKAHNIPIALATSSSAESYKLKTVNSLEVFDLFNHQVLGGSDPGVRRGKPCPDIFIVAAERFPEPADPAKCLVFEDAPNGVQAALAAGMQCVMVPDENLPKRLQTDATLVINSLEEFKPELFGLPAFPDKA